MEMVSTLPESALIESAYHKGCSTAFDSGRIMFLFLKNA